MQDHRVMMVAFLEPVQIGQTFSKWPHHITIVPWLLCRDLDFLEMGLAEICRGFTEIEYEVGDLGYLGPKKDVKVSLVRKNRLLDELHSKVLSLASNCDENFKAKFSKNQFLPHITHKDPPFPKKDDKRKIGEVYIVEDGNKGGVRRVVYMAKFENKI